MQGNFDQKKLHQHTCTEWERLWERQHLILTQTLEVVSSAEICLLECLNIATVPRNAPFNINVPIEII